MAKQTNTPASVEDQQPPRYRFNENMVESARQPNNGLPSARHSERKKRPKTPLSSSTKNTYPTYQNNYNVTTTSFMPHLLGSDLSSYWIAIGTWK